MKVHNDAQNGRSVTLTDVLLYFTMKHMKMDDVYLMQTTWPNWHLIVQSQQCNTRTASEISMLTIETPERCHWRCFGVFTVILSLFHAFILCFYSWLWTRKYRLRTMKISKFTQLTFTCSKSTIEKLEKKCEIGSKLTIKTERRHWRYLTSETFTLETEKLSSKKDRQISPIIAKWELGFSIKRFLHRSIGSDVLQIQKIHWKTPEPESFLIKLQAEVLHLHQKKDSGAGFSCEFCKIFKSTYFGKHLQIVTSDFWLIEIVEMLRIF